MTNTCKWVAGLAWESSSSLQLAGQLSIQLLVSRHFTYKRQAAMPAPCLSLLPACNLLYA